MAIEIQNPNIITIQQSFERKRVKRRPKFLPWLYPLSMEKAYQKVFTDFVDELKRLYEDGVKGQLQFLLSFREDEKRIDGIPEDIDEALNVMRDNIQRDISLFRDDASRVAFQTNLFNRRQWEKIVKRAFDVSLLLSEPWVNGTVESFVREGGSFIKSVANETIEKINESVQRGYRNGDSWLTISKRIETDIIPQSTRRARLIGRDQINKLNGQMMKQRQTDLGITKYIWRTALDEKVRPSHSVMEGRLCTWDDSTVYFGADFRELQRTSIGGVLLHPGQDIQCRCHSEAYFDEILGIAA